LTIIPIFRREMVAAARQGKLQGERLSFAILMSLLSGGSFAAWLYWAEGILDSGTMSRIAYEALKWSAAAQGGIVGPILVRAGMSIVKERERRTLDFLLGAPLSGAEIVLGKLVACVTMSLSLLAAGFPLMLLIHVLGGVELRLILLIYPAFTATVLFVSAMAIWISAEAPDRRVAIALYTLGMMGWLIGPFSLAVFPPRWGVRMPAWLAAGNWWLVASSPLSIWYPIALGLRSWDQLVYLVGRMIALQLAGAAILTTATILRLRPASRALSSLDRQAARLSRRRPVWRLQSRPPVGDDPILWREMHTSRINGLLKGLALLLYAFGFSLLVYTTVGFARPAFVELWQHGYGVGANGSARPEMNIFIRWFMPGSRAGGPIDTARMDFNLYIRYVTLIFAALMGVRIAICGTEAIGWEKSKETWTSLLATPMGPRAIVRAAMLAALWRTRGDFAFFLPLWVLGLASGAIHPLGFLVAALVLAASMGFLLAYGALVSIRAKDLDEAAGKCILLTMGLGMTGALPLLLPAGLNTVLWGAGSLPMMSWMSLFSYREAAAALSAPLDPQFEWVGLLGGQMPLLVLITWLLAILGPAIGGLLSWRYAVSHFDRLVGRPYRATAAPELDLATPSPAPSIARADADLARRGSPLAEADGAV
jgi:ABC-type transport system involved in multi-copper enzyme maturation permease subunit